MRTIAFIDASNLFYGGEKSLGWKIDYQKLLIYLKNKYGISKAFYFGGVEIHKFDFNYLKNETVDINNLEKYLLEIMKQGGDRNEGKEVIVLARGPRTAREIRQFAGSNFRDFEYLKYLLKMEENKRGGLI